MGKGKRRASTGKPSRVDRLMPPAQHDGGHSLSAQLPFPHDILCLGTSPAPILFCFANDVGWFTLGPSEKATMVSDRRRSVRSSPGFSASAA